MINEISARNGFSSMLFVLAAGSKTLAQSMFQRWLSPREEAVGFAETMLKLRTTTFDDVVDAQAAHYAVPAVVLSSIVKKVSTFYKLVACVMDEKRNRMWCEAIGSQGEMEGLLKSFVVGKPLLFSCLCYKRSPWHSGGKFLDLTKKQKVKVDALPPTHGSYATLKHVHKDGPTTLGDISGLRGLERGHKADLTGLVCSCDTKVLKDNQASVFKKMFCFASM